VKEIETNAHVSLKQFEFGGHLGHKNTTEKTVRTKTRRNIKTSRHQDISTSTHQHINTSTHQNIKTSKHQHINTSTHQKMETGMNGGKETSNKTNPRLEREAGETGLLTRERLVMLR